MKLCSPNFYGTFLVRSFFDFGLKILWRLDEKTGDKMKSQTASRCFFHWTPTNPQFILYQKILWRVGTRLILVPKCEPTSHENISTLPWWFSNVFHSFSSNLIQKPQRHFTVITCPSTPGRLAFWEKPPKKSRFRLIWKPKRCGIDSAHWAESIHAIPV